jgi:hypothetical protein
MNNLENLSVEGKEELALALILWKDFKTEGKADPELVHQMFQLAAMLDIIEQVNFLMPKIPPMKITPRYE